MTSNTKDSDDELSGRSMLNLPTERSSITAIETETNGFSEHFISRTYVIHPDEGDISASNYITDDDTTLPANSEVDRLETPHPSISQDSGVVCADYPGGEFERGSTRNNSVDIVDRESIQESLAMEAAKKTYLGYSPPVAFYEESFSVETGNASNQKEQKFLFKGFSTDHSSNIEPERLSAHHSVDRYRPGSSSMSIDKKVCFVMSSFLAETWIAILVCLIVGIILPAGLVKIMYHVGFPSVDNRVDSFRMNSHPASKQRFVVEEIFRHSEEQLRSLTEKENGRARRDLDFNDFVDEEDEVLKRQRVSINSEKRRYKSATVNFYYTTKKKKANIFTRDTLVIIHKFENEMVLREEFKQHCFHFFYHYFSYYTQHIDNCYPMTSVNGFFYPSPYRLIVKGTKNGTFTTIYRNFVFDGFGSNLTNFEDSFDLLKSRSDFYSYFDSRFDVNVRESTYIKSTLILGRTSRTGSEQDDIEKNKYILSQEDLIRKYEKKSNLKIYYYAGGLREYMLGLVIQADIFKTIISVSIIAVLVFFFTGGSPWLTFWTIVILLGSIVDNIFLYYIVFGIDKLGMLNAASGIILVSIGVDDVLVFINIFRCKSRQMNTREKVASTLHGAATSTFFTSITTSLAFSANAISPVPAVKSFGLFMATLVLVCWLLVVILMPPVLYLWETHLLGTKTVLFRKVERVRGKRKSRKADSEANSEEDESLQVCGIFKMWSVDIHSKLVLVLNKFTLFVIKIRWVLMGIWLVLFITSIYGVANLEADKNIPTVFSKSNRLEEAMKLGQKNAYSRDQLCTLCHPLRIRSESFFTENWNESREDVREISDQQKFYSRAANLKRLIGKDGRSYVPVDINKKRSADPVKPLSSTVPLVAVVFGIWDYKVMTNSFYYTEPEVSITEDENFLSDLRNYKNLNTFDAVKVALEIGDKVKAMCKMCAMIAENKHLVNEGRAQCIPPVRSLLEALTSSEHKTLIELFEQTFESFDECQGLPNTKVVSGDLAKGTVGYLNSKLPGYFIFVFESTMTKDDSAWDVRKQFIEWDDFVKEVSKQFSVSTGLSRPLFASDRFDSAFMEIAVQVGALYSMGIGMSSILVLLAFFTGYLEYLAIILLTVGSSVLVLFASFFYFNIKVGAVEIVVGSILVGSSVDYIFHLVESYSVYSRENSQDFRPGTASAEMRQANCARAVRRIGFSIISSSLTTVMGCLPLTLADLNPLRMFGTLIMISSASALIFTLLFGLPLLAIIAPVRAKVPIQRRLLVLFSTTGIFGLIILIAYTIAVSQGVHIIGPNGL